MIIPLDEYNELKAKEARLKAKEARLKAIKEAARHLVNELPEYGIDLAREVWGNTNANCVLNRRNKLAALVGEK